MGVKPNRKSSVPLVMLLLFLANIAVGRSGCPSDTLILDGEVIEIVESDESYKRDSLEDAGREDLKRSAQRKFNNHFGFQMGAVYNLAKASTDVPGFDFLPTYMDLNSYNAFGFDVQTSYRRDIGELQLFGAPAVWGVECGLGLQQLSWRSVGMDPEQISQDSVIGFRRDEDQLFLDYITIFDEPFPVFELDTIQLQLLEQKFVVNCAVVRLGPTLERDVTSSSKVLFSLGINYRAQIQKVKTNDQFWIGDNGQWRAQKADDLAMKAYTLSPYLRLGYTKELANRMRCGVALSAFGPASVINDNADLQWSNWQLLAQLTWSKSF